MTTPHHICLFGSSCSPPTLAHLSIASSLTLLPQFTSILVLPVYRHMFTSKRSLTLETNESKIYDHKLKMCEILFSSLPKTSISELESNLFAQKIDSTTNSSQIRISTFDVLTSLKSSSPHGTKFTLCLGEDTYMDLCSGKWRNGEEVSGLIEGCVVIPRGSDEISERTSLNDIIEIQNGLNEGMRFPANILEIGEDMGGLSSTKAREIMSCNPVKGGGEWRELVEVVGEGVAEYILENGVFDE